MPSMRLVNLGTDTTGDGTRDEALLVGRIWGGHGMFRETDVSHGTGHGVPEGATLGASQLLPRGTPARHFPSAAPSNGTSANEPL